MGVVFSEGPFYSERVHQVVDFTGIFPPPLCPMDVDGLIEYKDKAVIFYEVKYRDKEMPTGQRVALERLVKDVERSRRKGVALLVSHHIGDPAKMVKLKDCIVRKLYIDGKWRKPKHSGMSAKEATDLYIRWVEGGSLSGRG